MSAENRSEWAVTAAATGAPLLLWGCGASWLWLLAGGLLAVACCTPVLRGRETVPQLLRCTLGKRVGTGVLWLQLASLALGAGWLLRRAGGIVPNVTHGGPWIPLVIMLLALAGAWRGRKAALASGAVLFWLILLTVGVVAVCSLPQIRWERIQPVGGIGQVLPAAAMFLLPMLAVCAKKPDEKQNAWKLPGAITASAVAVAAITAGCLSPRLAATESLPFFTLAASCRLLGHAARFDAVLCMTVTAALYCLLVLMLNFCRQLSETEKQGPLLVFSVLALLCAWWAPVVPVGITGGCLVVLWGILPAYCAICEKRKKNAKK